MTSTKKKPTGDTATAELPGKAAAAKVADTTAKTSGAAKSKRSATEIAEVRQALEERLTELETEHTEAVAGISEMQKERLSDSAGDDQVDSGSKTVEREQEISLANSVRDRMVQVERALERLEDGDYGVCERCGTHIPAARLAAFPSATLCVDCKSVEERR